MSQVSPAAPTATRMSRSPGPGARPVVSKTLKLQRFCRRWTLASSLLTVLAMGGCLVPQDYRFSDDPPPFKNNPVKIVLPTEPEGTTITTNNGQGGGSGCSLDFSVFVTDPDLNDPITVQWFVDYDPVTNPSIYREELLNNVGTPVRGPADLRMDLDATGNPLKPAGLHVLEFLVADGQIVNRIPQPKSQDPDAGVNPSYVDRYVWIVNVEPGDCPLP